MSRFFYVGLIWLVLVGSLMTFLRLRGLRAQATPYQDRPQATGTYRLEITTTFSVVPDPFALVLNADEQPPALLVQLEGKAILRITDKLAQGETLVVEALKGLKTGTNEFFIKATPPVDLIHRSQALRLRLWQGNAEVADQTVWSVPPGPIATTITVALAPQGAESHDDHDH